MRLIKSELVYEFKIPFISSIISEMKSIWWLLIYPMIHTKFTIYHELNVIVGRESELN